MAREIQSSKEPGRKYGPGTIKRISMKNFMTYTDWVHYRPGPGLNLVLGSNGSGKSSFVSAICIGLGGSHKLLGRADNLKAFINRGEKEATVETVLVAPNGVDEIKIQRIIRKIKKVNGAEESYQSAWKVNGRDTTEKDMEVFVKELNIQLSNMCQFLPQDKVIQFARMSAAELLEETERAIGDGHLYLDHKQLIELKKDLNEKEFSYRRTVSERDRKRQEQEAAQRDYDRCCERDQLKELLALIKLKGKVEKRDAAKIRWEDARMHLEKAKKKQEDKLKEEKAGARPCQELVRAKEGLEGELKRRRTETQQAQRQLIDLQNDAEALDDKIHEKMDEWLGLRALSADWSKRQQESRAKCQQAEARLAQTPSSLSEELVKHRAQLDQECLKLKEVVSYEEEELKQSQDRYMEMKRRFNDKHRFRISKIEQRCRGIVRVMEWINANRNTFRAPVFGPILAEIEVADAKYAPFVESQCWKATSHILTLDMDDQSRIAAQLRQMQIKGISIASITGPFDNVGANSSKRKDLERYGIRGSVDDVIIAPPPIKKYLRDVCNTHNAFIGNEEISQRFDDLREAHQQKRIFVPTIWTTETKYTLMLSKYADTCSASLNDVYPANILADAQHDAGQEDQKNKLHLEEQQMHSYDASLRDKRPRLAQLEAELQAVFAEEKRVKDEYRRVFNARAAAAAARATAEREPDPLLRGDQIKAYVAQDGKKLLGLWKRIAAATQRVAAAIMEEGVMEMKVSEAQARLLAAQLSRGGLEREKAILQQEVQSARQAEALAKQAYTHAEDALPIDPISNQDLQKLSKLPSDPRDLAKMEEETEEKISEIVVSNPGAVVLYKERMKELEKLDKQEEKQRQELGECKTKLTTIRARWEPELNQMVDKLREAFTAAFSTVGTEGGIHLKKTDDAGQPVDFDRWEMQILVRFRAEEELRPLGARQSGGERSVSTMVYIIALQSVTVTPFRVVDEINQGMDNQNERKVFQKLVESSSQPNTPQCFLLTPKLLPDLEYNEHINVMILINTSTVEDAIEKDFNFQEVMYGNRYKRARIN